MSGLVQSGATKASVNATRFGGDTQVVACSAGTGLLQDQMLFVLKGDGKLCDSSIRRLKRAMGEIHEAKKHIKEQRC